MGNPAEYERGGTKLRVPHSEARCFRFDVVACFLAAVEATNKNGVCERINLIRCVNIVVVVDVQMVLVLVPLAPTSDDGHKVFLSQKIILIVIVADVLNPKSFQGIVLASLQSAGKPIRRTDVLVISGHRHGYSIDSALSSCAYLVLVAG